MSMKTDLKPKLKVEKLLLQNLPSLSLPIKVLEYLNEWYEKDNRIFLKILKYPFHLLGLLFGLLLTPLAMCIDFTVGILAGISSFASKIHQVKYKQLAWDCLICATMGGIHTISKIAKKIIFFKKA